MHLVNSNAPYNAASKVLYKDKLTVMYRRNFFSSFFCVRSKNVAARHWQWLVETTSEGSLVILCSWIFTKNQIIFHNLTALLKPHRNAGD